MLCCLSLGILNFLTSGSRFRFAPGPTDPAAPGTAQRELREPSSLCKRPWLRAGKTTTGGSGDSVFYPDSGAQPTALGSPVLNVHESLRPHLPGMKVPRSLCGASRAELEGGAGRMSSSRVTPPRSIPPCMALGPRTRPGARASALSSPRA